MTTLNQQIRDLASLTFDQGVANFTSDDYTESYQIHDFNSCKFETLDEMYENFYMLWVQKYTNLDHESWPDGEVILSPSLTYGHTIRIDVHALCEVLRLPPRLSNTLLDHAIEFAVGKAVLTNSDDYPLVDIEELYRASVLMVGFGMTDLKVVEWLDWQRPSSKLPVPLSTPNFGEN